MEYKVQDTGKTVKTDESGSSKTTSRNRLLTALAHREPDRIPIDFGGTDTSTIMVGPYLELAKKIGIDPHPIYMPCPTGGTVDVASTMIDAMGGDTRLVTPYPRKWRDVMAYDGTPVRVPNGFQPETATDGSQFLRNESGAIASKMPPGSGFFFNIDHPFASIKSPGELGKEKEIFNRIDRPAFSDLPLETFGNHIRKIRENNDKILVWGFGGHIFEAAMQMRGASQFLLDLIENPKLAEAILDRITNAHIVAFDRFAETIGQYIDVIQVLDDMGTQTSPWLSPDMYRRIVKPYHAKFFRHIKQNSNIYIMLHTDGAVYPLIPDFIEMGIDILNPVQYTATGMDLKTLKHDFGNDITFWGGGIDTQHALGFNTPAEIEDEVKQNIDILAPGGGFVFATVHNILEGVPVENIITVFRTAMEYGKY